MKIKFFYIFVAYLLASLCGSYAYSQNKSEVIEVPFTFERSSVIVQVKVNGKGSYNMLLDTGAEQSAVDLKTAKELGLKLNAIGGGKIVATGKKENTLFLTNLPQIELGSLIVKDLLAVATDFSRISQRIGIPVHGVVGYNFLKGRIVQFDYPKRVIRFYSKSPVQKSLKPNTATRMVLTFRFYAGDKFPTIDEVYVNGKKIKAELDTGHSGVLALTAAAIKRLGLEAEAQAGEPETSEGALGTSVNRKGKLKTLTVGSVTIDSPTVSFRAAGSGLDEAPFDGLLGNDFFKDFVVNFDYRSMMVMLEAKSQSDTRVIDSLPAPDDKEISKIRTGNQWHNPYVIVTADGYELILHGQPRDQKLLNLDELEEALLKLPLQRWPLGRVVAVQEAGLRDPADTPTIAAHSAALMRMLKSHKLRADQWPSG